MLAEMVLASVTRGVGGRPDRGPGRRGRGRVIGAHTKDDADMRNNEFHKPMAPWVGNENCDESGVGRYEGDRILQLHHLYNPKYTHTTICRRCLGTKYALSYIK